MLAGNPFFCDCQMDWLHTINTVLPRRKYPKVSSRHAVSRQSVTNETLYLDANHDATLSLFRPSLSAPRDRSTMESFHVTLLQYRSSVISLATFVFQFEAGFRDGSVAVMAHFDAVLWCNIRSTPRSRPFPTTPGETASSSTLPVPTPKCTADRSEAHSQRGFFFICELGQKSRSMPQNPTSRLKIA